MPDGRITFRGWIFKLFAKILSRMKKDLQERVRRPITPKQAVFSSHKILRRPSIKVRNLGFARAVQFCLMDLHTMPLVAARLAGDGRETKRDGRSVFDMGKKKTYSYNASCSGELVP